MTTIFYDVDTQNDFMNKDGKLYVNGAEDIKPNLAALTQYARKKGIGVIASTDAHDEHSAELQVNGGPFPYHAMKGSEGQKKIPETQLEHACIVPNTPVSKIEEVIRGSNQVIIEKDDYDSRTNPNFDNVIRITGATKAIVYGVATDYCVRAVGLALRALGLETIIVTDAIAAVAADTEKKSLEELTRAGVQYTTTKEVLEGKHDV